MSNQSEDEIFESIIEENDLQEWMDHSHVHSMTISDIYQGIAILSSLQVDLHEYLKRIIEAVFKNNSAGYEIMALPQLTAKQIANLKQIFESSAIFLEE